jgi:hypothetical protein
MFICLLNLCWISIVNATDESIECIVIFTKYASKVRARSTFWMFDENDWIFKAHKLHNSIHVWSSFLYVIFIVYKQINRRMIEFTVASNTEFKKNHRSWNFETREQKKF